MRRSVIEPETAITIICHVSKPDDDEDGSEGGSEGEDGGGGEGLWAMAVVMAQTRRRGSIMIAMEGGKGFVGRELKKKKSG